MLNEIYQRLKLHHNTVTLHKLMRQDLEYQKEERKLGDLEEKYLRQPTRTNADNYIDQLQRTDAKIAELSYLAGLKDCRLLIKFLKY